VPGPRRVPAGPFTRYTNCPSPDRHGEPGGCRL